VIFSLPISKRTFSTTDTTSAGPSPCRHTSTLSLLAHFAIRHSQSQLRLPARGGLRRDAAGGEDCSNKVLTGNTQVPASSG
jgi:hypothetical protein